jgi:hypothetical protein
MGKKVKLAKMGEGARRRVGKQLRGNLPKKFEIPLAYTPARIDQDAEIVKANAIINACYYLPLNAHRILCFYLSVLTKNEEGFPLMKIPVAQVAETFPGLSSSNTAYYDVGYALENLSNATIHIKQGNDWIKFRWAPTCGRIGGWIFIRLNEDLKPYLLGLLGVGKYAHYRLRFVLELRTSYQFRFYELLKSYQYLGGCPLYYEELKDWLEIPKDQYTNVGHFKDKILDPSIEAINDVTDILVSILAPIKDSRRIIGWRFKVRAKPQEMLPLAPSVTPLVERLITDGFSTEESKILARDYDAAYLLEKIEWVEAEFEEGKVDNMSAFLRKAIHEDWHSPVSREERIARRKATLVVERREREVREEYQQKVRQAREHAPLTIRIRKAEARMKECPLAELQELERKFADHIMRLPSSIARRYAELRHESALVKSAYRLFLIEYFDIPEPTLQEIQDYLAELIPPEYPPIATSDQKQPAPKKRREPRAAVIVER